MAFDKMKLSFARWLGVQGVVEDARGTPESIANQMDAAQITSALINAEQGYVGDLWNLYDSIMAGDVWIQSMLNQRKLAVLNDVIQAEPEDKNNPADVQAAAEVNASIKRLRRFRMGTLSHLMDGCLRPVSVCEMVFRVDTDRPGRYLLDRVVPVPHYCQTFEKGTLELFRQDAANSGRIIANQTYACEAGHHIVHRGHMLTMPDSWGGPMRCLVFLWLLKTANREWWARSVERWGAPIPLGKYPTGDSKAKAALQAAFSRFYRLGGLTVSDQTSVELIAGPAAGDGSVWEKLQSWAERQITIAILGQELSTGAKSTGLGSGVANLQGAVRDDITLMDTIALAETLTTDFAGAILRANAMPGHCTMTIGLGTSIGQARELGTFLASVAFAGIEAQDSAIRELGKLAGLDLQRKPVSAAMGLPGQQAGGAFPGQTLSALSSLFGRGYTPHQIATAISKIVEEKK